jgi:protoporphyrinogen oxidase
MADPLPVVVLGAGLAGLTAGTYLRRHGIDVKVFEAGPHVAGLARSFQDADGFTYDFGAHFITNRLAAAVGCSATCRHMPRYGESVWLRGRAYRYPFGLMRSPRLLASAAVSRLRGLVGGPPPRSAADWYRAKYGRRLAEEVAAPLTEAWSGVPAAELAAAVGQKFASSIPRTILLRLAARLTRRTVAVGYCGTMPESPHVWHVYPEGGVGAVCERLADEIRQCIHTQTPVEEIHVEGQRVVGVRAGGRDVAASAVISTAPVHILARLVRGTDRLTPLACFRYRPMVFVNLRFSGRGLLPDVVNWVPDRSSPFFRLTETGVALPWLVPEGKTLITADIGCAVGDAIWTMADDDLGRLCVEHLAELIPDAARRYLGCAVLRTPLAYPVYRLDYEADRQALERSTGVEGLYSIGRNGEFAHILMEDVYWRTRAKMRQLLAWREGLGSQSCSCSLS